MSHAPPIARPLRVLQVTEAAGGGVRRHLQRLLPELRQGGMEVDVLLASGRAEPGLDGDLASYRALGCRTATFSGRGTLGTLWRGIPAFRQALRAWHPDVVHLHATRAGLLGRLGAPRAPRSVLVYSPHAFAFQATAPPLQAWLARRLERFLAGRTAALVCVAQAERDLALAALGRTPAGRLVVIENGLEAQFRDRLLPRDGARAEWGIPPEECLLGFAGRLVPQKDLETLLRALALARPRLPRFRLAVCGNGPLETSLRALADALGLEAQITWRGFVADLPRRMAAFDLLALPSRYEGFSYTLLEALAAGVPVLATDLPANLPRPELRGPICLLEPGAVAAWAEGLVAALHDLPARQQQTAALAAWVCQEFSASRQAAALAALYASLAATSA